ncbi:MAG: sugar transferase [Ilumatobacteraceae bacterium]
MTNTAARTEPPRVWAPGPDHDIVRLNGAGSPATAWFPVADLRAEMVAGDPVAPTSLRRRHLKACLVGADALSLLLGLAVSIVVQRVVNPVPASIVANQLRLFVLAVPAYAVGAFALQLYRHRANERRAQEWANICKTVVLGAAGVVSSAFFLHDGSLSRLWISALIVCTAVAIVAEREITRRAFVVMRRSGRLRRRIAIVGTDAHAIELSRNLNRQPELGYEVVGLIDTADLEFNNGTAPLVDWLNAMSANGVVICPGSLSGASVNRVTRQLTEAGFHTSVYAVLHDIDVVRIRPQQIDGDTLLYVEPVERGGWRSRAKRTFDVVVAFFGLVLALPLLLLAAIAIKIDSRGPVMFRQRRTGIDGREFELLKLRTMSQDAEARLDELAALNEADGPMFKIHRDPRITSVGRLLRKLSIDEIPQLVNVLIGTMSVVGPRPALPREATQWDDELRNRLRVLPGITGLWQVSGRSDCGFDQYRRLDLYYVDNWSLGHDVKICLRTIQVVLSGRGAS